MKPAYNAPDGEWLATHEIYGDCKETIWDDAKQNAADKLRLMSALESLAAECVNSVEYSDWPELIQLVTEAHALLKQLKQR